MIVEVFKRGTNFKEFIYIEYNVDKIDNHFDSEKYILIKEHDINIVLDANEVELKIS